MRHADLVIRRMFVARSAGCAGSAIACAFALSLLCASGHAAQGDCGQPLSNGDDPLASDCLFILRTAVGIEVCDPVCVCDTNGGARVTASDALLCLKKAVRQDVLLECTCGATSTTSTSVRGPTTTSVTTTTLPATTTTLGDPTAPVCGDGTCYANEACETCASECGACPGCLGAGNETASLDSQEAALLVLLNDYRSASGRGLVAGCTSLHRAAQGHSEDMRDNDYFDHVGLDGSSPWDRACDACFELGCGPQTAMTENIAAGNGGGQATFDQWRNSPGHDAAMLGSSYTRVGIGRALLGGTYGIYWTLLLAGDPEPSCN